MGNNRGVTLISILIIIIVLVIISSVSIIGGLDILQNSKESNKEENLAAVKSAVNEINIKIGTSGIFTPADVELYGRPAAGVLSGDTTDWYILDQDALEQMGISYANESYIVNYKENKVISMTEYLSVGVIDANKNSGGPAPNSITELAKKGKIKVGDYVDYVPDVSSYTTNMSEEYETGVTTSETLNTVADLKWRVWDIKATEIQLIAETSVNSVSFRGSTGYVNGPTVLNDICNKLYSNNSLSSSARSINLQDIESKMKNNNKEGYINDANHKYGEVNTWTGGTYYTYEDDGNTITTKIPKIASSSNPVTVKNTFYKFNLSNMFDFENDKFQGNNGKNNYSTFFSNGDTFWLATQYITWLWGYEGHDMYSMSSYGYSNNGFRLFDSHGYTVTKRYKIRPIINLSSNVLVNIKDENFDGSTSDKAWKLKN